MYKIVSLYVIDIEKRVLTYRLNYYGLILGKI